MKKISPALLPVGLALLSVAVFLWRIFLAEQAAEHQWSPTQLASKTEVSMDAEREHGEPGSNVLATVPLKFENKPAAQGNVPAQAPLSQVLPDDFLAQICQDNQLSLTLPDGQPIRAQVMHTEHDALGIVMVAGKFETPTVGSYFFRRLEFQGIAGRLVGHVVFDGLPEAWKILPEGPDGAPLIKKVPLDEVMCVGYKPEGLEALAEPEAMPSDHTSTVPIPNYQTVIPLQSLPGGAGTIYLDFDGEKGPFPGWWSQDAAPSGFSNATIRDIWMRVAEDFLPFNLNVTTDVKVYQSTPQGRRIRCIISPTYNGGGVAFVGSYNWGGEPTCWSNKYTGDSAVTVISHEVGHTLGLYHHGQGSREYYGGQGSGVTSWAPIMGVGYGRYLKHWSNGDYYEATKPNQHDLQIIERQNAVDFRSDDAGDSLASATYLALNASGSVSNQQGIIGTTGDVDAYRFQSYGGTVSLNVSTTSVAPNLDIKLEITRVDLVLGTDPESGNPITVESPTIIASDNPGSTLSASITTSVTAGHYILKVIGTGFGDPANLTGYSNYGSLGSYRIDGSVSNADNDTVFSLNEHSANGTTVGTIAPRVLSGPLSYAIASGNTGNAFSIHSATGQLTVSNTAALDYEVLSTRFDDPSEILLFVTITDTNLATETVRVRVRVVDVNEAPTITSWSDATVMEGTVIGTSILQLTGSDADRFDFPTYEIQSGNEAGYFELDPATGKITVVGTPDVSENTLVTLIVRARDQNALPLYSVPRTVNLTIVPVLAALDTDPGGLYRTFFNGITGSGVSDLTGSVNFPNKPDKEVYLTAFDGGASKGDNYGSTIRGYVIPPITGAYTFWIAADNGGELRLSTGMVPANASVIASVATSGEYQWDAQVAQQSVPITLTAGQAYYIEARHKESTYGDHLAVAWSGPGITRQVIPGLYLAPYYQNYAPYPSGSLSVQEVASAGTVIGRVSVSDVNTQDTVGDFTITSGNSAGLFSINPNTGDITLTTAGQFNVVNTPYYDLAINVTDNGSPALSGTGFVRITVLPNTLYFDPNGATAGSVSNGGTYQWRTTAWAAGPGGTLAPQTWSGGSQAVFSATSPAKPLAYSVDIGGYNSGTHGGFTGINALAGTVRFTGTVDNFYCIADLKVTADPSAAIEFNQTRPGATLQAFNLNGKTATFQGDVTFITCGMGNSGHVVLESGNLTLTTANSYTGNTTLNGGTLRIPEGGSIYNSGHNITAVLTVNSGGTLELNRWGYGPGTANQSLGGLDYNPARFVINGGRIRYTGGVAGAPVSAYESQFGPGFTLKSGGAILEAAKANDTWTVKFDSRGAAPVVSNEEGLLTLTGIGNGVFDKELAGGGALSKTGSGTWILNRSNTYSGGTTVSEGTLQIDSVSSLPGATNVTADSNDELIFGTLFMNVPNTTWNQNISGAGHWRVATGVGSENTNLTGNYSGFTGTLEAVSTGGGGKLVLPNSLNYLAAGSTLEVGENSSVFLSGGGTFLSQILLHGGTIGEPSYGQLRISPAGAVLSGGIVLNAHTSFAVDSSGTATVSGIIGESGGNFGFVKKQPGTLILTGVNTYSGDTIVNTGTLKTGTSSGTFGQGNLTVENGATCMVEHTQKAFGRQAYISVNGSGKLSLASGVSETVARFYINGVAKTPGTYTKNNSSGVIIGNGSLIVGETVPEAPSNMAATLSSWNSILLTWSHVAVNLIDIRLERSSSPNSGFVELQNLAADARSTVDVNLPANTTYYYRVRAQNSLGFSAYSAVVGITTGVTSPPSGLTASAGNAVVELSWLTNPEATSYNIKRATVSGGPYTNLGSVFSGVTSYSDSTVVNGTYYYYVVTCSAAGGESAASNEITARPLPPTGTGIWNVATGGNWGDADNWLNYVVADGIGHSATFANVGGGVITVDDTGRVLSNLNFANGNYTIQGNLLTLDVASGMPNVSVGAGKSATLTTGLAGNDGLNKIGGGTLVLANGSSYSGSTTVNEGTLALDSGYASNSYAINTGASLQINTVSTDISGAGVTFSGAGILRKTGANRLYWSNSVANFAMASGALIDVQGGTFVGGSTGNEIWSSNLADLNVAAGAVFDGVEANVRVDALTGSGTIKTGYNGAGYTEMSIGVDNGTSSFGGVIANSSSTGKLQKEGTGTITLTGANTFSGNVDILTGALRITKSTGLGSGTKTVTINAGNDKRLELDGTSGNIILGAGISYQTSGVNGVIRNIAGTNTIQGAITMTAGNGNTRVISDGGTLTLAGNISASTTGRVLDLAGTSSADNTFNAVLSNSNAPGLQKSGAGKWIVSGVNTYSGATTVSGGILTLSGARLASSPAGAISVSNIAGTDATLNIQAGSHALGGNTISVAGAPTIPAVGIVNQTGGAVTFTSGNQLLIGNGGGIANTGIYNLSGGSLTTVASTSRGIMLGVHANVTATFSLSGTGVLNMTSASGSTGDAVLQIGRYDSDADNVTASYLQTGGIAHVGLLSIGGNGTTSSGGSCVFSLTSGTFTANQFPRLAAGYNNNATITIGGVADVTLPAFPTTRGSGSSVTLNFDGGILRPASSSAIFLGGLTNAYIKAGGARVDVPIGRDITITQSLLTDTMSIGGGFTKSGAGVLTLSGSNTYSGMTTVMEGTLLASSTAVLGVGNLVVQNAAICELQNQNGAIANGASVYLAGTGKLNLGSGVAETVARLYIDGQIQSIGTYTNASHPAAILGDGSLIVTDGKPAQPTGLTATAASSSSIQLSWNDNTNESGYTLESATSAGSGFVTLAVLPAGSGAYTHTGLAANTTRYYRLRASNGFGDSLNSLEVAATTFPNPPAAPTGLTATPSVASVGLAWSTSPGATSYTVKIATLSGGPYTTIATDVTETNFICSSLVGGTTYYFVVSAVNAGGEGVNSSQASAIPLSAWQWDGGDTVNAGAQGGNGSWDTTSSNWWTGAANASWPTTGTNNDAVFDGAAGTVTLVAGGVSANDLTFSTDGYALSGGPLTLSGTSPVIAVFAGTTSISSSIAGAGGWTKSGAGSLRLSSGNSFTGTTVIAGGILIAQHNTALGASGSGNGTTVQSGATLDMSGTLATGTFNLGSEIVTASGVGVGGNGAIVNRGSNDQTNALQKLVLAGPVTLGGTKRWDLRGAGNSLDMAGFTMTKVGANTIALVGTTISNPGHIIVNQGVFGFHTNGNLGGAATNTLTVRSGASADFYANTGTKPWTLILEDGALTTSSGSSTWGGPCTLAGLVGGIFTINTSHSFTVNGSIGESSAGKRLSKNGNGGLTLSQVNNYTGGTFVNAGTLTVGATSSLGAGHVTIATGATCALQNSAGSIADAAFVYLTGTGKLELATGVTETVARLYVNSAVQLPGQYTQASHPALIQGAGTLVVTEGIPTAPQSLVAADADTDAISLAWMDTATNETTYVVERSTTPVSGFVVVATLGANSVSYVDADSALLPGAVYYYRVFASNGLGNSAYSNELIAETVCVAPESVIALPGNTNVTLTWAQMSGAATYNVKRATQAMGPYTLVGNTSANIFLDSGLTNDTTYYYVVSALNSGGESAHSIEVFTTPRSYLEWDAADVVNVGAQGGSGLWDMSSANWWNSVANTIWVNSGTDNDALFGESFGTVTIDASGVSVNDIRVTSDGYSFMGGGIVFNGTNPGFDITVGTTTCASSIAGGSGLRKSGDGILVLSGNPNTYSGGTSIVGGTISISSNTHLGETPLSASPGNIKLDGGALRITGSNVTIHANRGVLIGSNGGKIIANSGNNGFAGIIDGPGMLTIAAGSGVYLTGTAAHSYTGGTTLAQGSSTVVTGNLGFGSGPVILAGGAIRATTSSARSLSNPILFAGDTVIPNVAGAQSLTFTGPITLTGATRTLTQNSSATVTISNAISDAGNGWGLKKSGSGVLVLSGPSSYTGATTITEGSVVLSGGDNRLSTATTVVLGSATSSGKLVLGNSSSASNQSLAGLTATGMGGSVVGAHTTNSNLTLGVATGTQIYSGVLGGVGTNENNLSLTKSGAGTLVLSANNTFRGDVVIGANSGDVEITQSGALGSGTKTVQITGNTGARPTLVLNGSSGAIVLPTSISLQTSNDSTSDPAIRNFAGFNRILGTINLTLGGGNTAIVVDNGALELADITNVLASSERAVKLGGADIGTVAGVISNGANTVSLIKEGAGTWSLMSQNTYTGTTTVNDGVLECGIAGTFGTGNVIVNATAMARLRNPSGSIENTAIVYLNSAASLDIAAGVFDAVSRLYVNTMLMPVGTYTADNLPGFITGDGSLVVTDGLPAAPSGLSATATSSSSVELSWNDNTNESAYVVEISTAPHSGFTAIASLAEGVTSFTSTGLSAGTTYYYRVMASNGFGNSEKSPTVSATTIPPAPLGLVATAAGQAIRLDWSATQGATGYRVERSTTQGGGYISIANTVTHGFTDSGLLPGLTYYYIVIAENTAGYGASSSEVSGVPLSFVEWDGSDSLTLGAQGGAGIWDAQSTNWWNGFTNAAWPTTGIDNDAIFGGTGATIVLDAAGISANDITFNSTGYVLTGGNLTLTGLPVISTANGTTTTILSGIGGSGGLVKASIGTLILSGANDYLGATTIRSGTLVTVGGDNRLPVTSALTLGDADSSGKLVLGGETGASHQILTGLATSGLGGSVVGGAGSVSTLTLNLASGTSLFAGTLGGLGANENNLAFAKSGAGTCIITGANSYTGGTTVNAGWLSVTSDNQLGGTSGAVTLSANTGNGLILGNGFVGNRQINLVSASEMVVAAGNLAQWNGPIQLTGAGAQIRTGTSGGTLVLSGTVMNGTVSNNPLVVQGQTLELKTGFSLTGNNSAGNVLVGRSSTPASLIVKGTASAFVANILLNHTTASSAATLTLLDSAELLGHVKLDLHFNGAATSNTTVNLNGGTLSVGQIVKTKTGVNQTAVVNFDGGELKALASATNFWNALAGTSVRVKAGGAKIHTNGFDISIAQSLLHDPALGLLADGGLVKKGIGTLVMSGAHSYTGPTTVLAGTFAPSGAFTSSITAEAAILAPQGVVSTTGALTLFSEATCLIRVTSSSADKISASALNLAGALLLDVGSGLTAGANFVILDNTGTNPVAGTFVGLPEGAEFSVGGYVWHITYLGGDGNDVVIRIPTEFERWRMTHFSTLNNTGLAAADADPDGDGEVNEFEFASLQNPQAGTRIEQVLTIMGSHIRFAYARNIKAVESGYTFHVEHSDTLGAGTWTDVGEGTVISTLGDRQSMQIDIPIAPNAQRRFVRMRMIGPVSP